MARIPDATQIQRRDIGSGGAVTSLRPSPVGEAVAGVGDIIRQEALQRHEQKTRYRAAQAESEFLIGKTKLEGTLEEDQDYETMPERYQQAMDELLGQTAEQISDPALRQEFLAKQQLRIAQGTEKIKNLALNKETDAERANIEQRLADLREVVIKGGGQEAMEGASGIIEEAVELGYYGREEAGEVMREWKASAAQGWVESLPPEQAVDALESDLADNLPTDTRNILLRQKREELNAAVAIDTVDSWMAEGKDRTDMMAEAEKIEDATLRQEVERRAEIQTGLADKARLERQKELFDEYFLPVRNGELSVDSIPREELEELTPQQQNNLFVAESQAASTAAVRSDPIVVDELHRLNETRQYGKLREFFLENYARLSSSDIDTWAQKSIDGVAPEPYETLIVKQQLLKSKMRDAGIGQNNVKNVEGPMLEQLRSWYLNQHQESGKLPDDKSVEDKIDQLLIKTSQGPAWFGSNYLYELDAEGLRETVQNIEQSNPQLYTRVLNDFRIENQRLADELQSEEPSEQAMQDFIEAYEYVAQQQVRQ